MTIVDEITERNFARTLLLSSKERNCQSLLAAVTSLERCLVKMFAGKQKAFSLPSVDDFHKLWLQQSYQLSRREVVDDYAKSLIAICLRKLSTWLSANLNGVADTAGGDNHTSVADRRSADCELEGNLAVLSCSALLQALGLAMVTGRLSISTSQGSGEIFLSKGTIEQSRWLNIDGRESVIEMLLLKSGRFAFKPENVPAAKEAKVSLAEIILDAAHREDQLQLLHLQFDCYSLKVSLKPGSVGEQVKLSKKLLSVGGASHLVYCLKILQTLQSAPLTVNALMEQTKIGTIVMRESLSLLTRFGFIQIRRIQNLSSLDDTVENFDTRQSRKPMYQYLQNILDQERAVSFILVKTLLSSVTTTISDNARKILTGNDQIFQAGDDQLLIVLKQTDSTQAATFVRDLRRAVIRSKAAKAGEKGRTCTNYSFFLSAIVSSPEDGINVKTLLRKAKLSLRIKKKFGRSLSATAAPLDFAVPYTNAQSGYVLVEF